MTSTKYKKNYTLNIDILSCIVGEEIGCGSTRSVYKHATDDTKVIKLEGRNGRANISEEMIWDQIQFFCGELSWIKDWFAPVEWISPNGKVLCMAKTTPHDGKRKLPEKIPSFLCDVKLENFGRYKGKFVCHDYGNIYSVFDFKNKMKNIKRK